MALHHADSGEVVDIRPLGGALKEHNTRTLVNTNQLEIIRLVLPAGKEIPQHRAPREITVQCIEGKIEFTAHGETKILEAGQMLYLAAEEAHSLKAVEDSTVLLTLLLDKG